MEPLGVRGEALQERKLWSSFALRSLSFSSSFNFRVIGMTPSFQSRRSVEGCDFRTVCVELDGSKLAVMNSHVSCKAVHTEGTCRPQWNHA